jgi:hypothetical protein
MKRRHARWLVALWVAGGLALLIVMAAIILPPVLSADYHRAAIEALASRLTGRQVIIQGPIRLSMVPDPQLNANTISIGMPHGEQISAESLRLDLAPRALLLGRLRATRLTLHTPRIVIPWPLPDGAASILPPPWLASLHAKVENGTIILGKLVFEHADLSIFTGGGNAVLAASGTGTMFGTPVSARLSLVGMNSQGLTPVIASIVTPAAASAQQKAGLSFSGTVDTKSQLTGSLAGSAVPAMAQLLLLGHALPAAPIQFTARAVASRTMIRLTAINLTAGAAALQAHAAIDLVTGTSSLAVRGHDIDITPVVRLLGENGQRDGTMKLRARLTGARLGGFGFASLMADLGITPEGTVIRAFSADLPGQGRLGLTGTFGPRGLRGAFTLADQAPAALMKAAAKAVPALSGLPPLTEPLHLAGSVNVPFHQNIVRLGALRGGTGPNHQETSILSTGALTATLIPVNKAQRLGIAAGLDFVRLDITPLLNFIKADAAVPKGLRLDVALTARQAQLGGIKARRLLLDAKLDKRLTIRALDFHALTRQDKQAALVALRGIRAAGVISGANLLVAGPDAAQAMALLPQQSTLPGSPRFKAMMKVPFAASFSASGPLAALNVQAAANLGEMRIRGTPKVDLANHTASGPVSFRMPDAIALAKFWDKHAGLVWPGPGSIGLRADFTYAPKHLGLSDFVLSFGALTASGRLALDYAASPATLSGVVNADMLALPPANTLLRLANAPGRIAIQMPDIRAAHILLGGLDIADDASARLSVTPGAAALGAITLGVDHVNLAGGILTGKATLNAAAGATPPHLKADLKLVDADAAALQPAFAAIRFPPIISAGHVAVNLSAQASGYTMKTWAATLGGALDASGTALTVQGINLAAATGPALLTGSTDFATLALAGSFADGAFTIGNAKLNGIAGSMALNGSVDLPGKSLAIAISLQPKGAATSKVAFSGPWAHPKRIVTEVPVQAQAAVP